MKPMFSIEDFYEMIQDGELIEEMYFNDIVEGNNDRDLFFEEDEPGHFFTISSHLNKLSFAYQYTTQIKPINDIDLLDDLRKQINDFTIHQHDILSMFNKDSIEVVKQKIERKKTIQPLKKSEKDLLNKTIGRLIFLMQEHKIFPKISANKASKIFQDTTGTSEDLRQYINDGKALNEDENTLLIKKLEAIILDLKQKK